MYQRRRNWHTDPYFFHFTFEFCVLSQHFRIVNSDIVMKEKVTFNNNIVLPSSGINKI